MTDLEQAIKNFRAADLRYDKPERYYRGDHDLAFATEKFENAFGNLFREFALNLCPAICDAVRDKLKISGFTVSDSGHTGGNTTVRECVSTLPNDAITRNESIPHPVHTIIEQIWDDNRLDLTAEEIHLEALKVGDSYAIVWPDENGEVTIYPQRAALCTVVYDDEMPGQMRWAAKYWRLTDDGRVRLNLIYPDRIEKYISRAKSELSLPDAREFHLVGDESGDAVNTSDLYRTSETGESSIVTNPFGVVPLFHFANTSEIGSFGRSELAQAIPIQNGLNKAVLDMLVAMEFSAFRQRWIAGIEIEYDEKGVPTPPFKSGMDRLWMSSNPQTTFGDFNTTDLDQFLKVKDSFRVDIASVTGTPLHYFLQSVRGFASGEALKRAPRHVSSPRSATDKRPSARRGASLCHSPCWLQDKAEAFASARNGKIRHPWPNASFWRIWS